MSVLEHQWQLIGAIIGCTQIPRPWRMRVAAIKLCIQVSQLTPAQAKVFAVQYHYIIENAKRRT